MSMFHHGIPLKCDEIARLEKENASLKESLFQIFKKVREIRDREQFITGLLGLENYIAESIEGGEG